MYVLGLSESAYLRKMRNLLSITGAFAAATLLLLAARPTESSFATTGRRRRRSTAGASVWLTARSLSTQDKIQVSQADIPRDLDAIRKCRAAAFDGDANNKPMLDSQRNFLNATSVAAGRTTCFVARDSDDRWPTLFPSAGPAHPVLGTADVKFRSNNRKACCFINNVFVTPPARGRGVGKRLLQAVEQAAIDKYSDDAQTTAASLEVYTSNTAAVALYRSSGYRPAGIHNAALARLGAWTNFGFQIQMTKDLSAAAAPSAR